MATEQVTSDPALRPSAELLRVLGDGYHPRDFAVRFWDGSCLEPEPGHDALFTLVLRHPGTLKKMLWPPNGLAFAEAYVYDDFDVEGDMLAFIRFIQFLVNKRLSVGEMFRLGVNLFRLPRVDRPRTGYQPVQLRGRKHSLERDRQAIGYHYDQSNDFFGLWLDEKMLYTCAYFTDEGESLEAAQTRKVDYVCRKLRLKPGERLLDIGCGWGGLVLHAVKNYGVEALGVTLSQKQVELANERIRQAGLEGRCRVEYRDYREISDDKGFDKISCIGMLEHLGETMLPVFFREAYRLLRPSGVLLNHGITLNVKTGYPRWTAFARKYVFPDGGVRPVTSMVREAEKAGFEVRDVENLREHYVLTLRHWLRRLEARHDDVVRISGETAYRVFRIYLAGAWAGMKNGTYNLHQELLAKPDGGKTGLPLTPADWYA